MASGPYPDPRRGTWSVQWWDGTAWKRVVVVRRRPGWRAGDPMPRKPPAEATRALVEYQRREDAARLASPAGERGEVTVAAFLGAYQADYPPGHAVRSAQALGYAVRSFLAHCDAAGVARLADVTSDVCEAWAAGEARKGHGWAYIKQRRSLLAAAWARLVRKGKIAVNPWRAVAIPGKPGRRQRGSWSPDQFRKLIDASAPWLRDVLTVGCHTGLRITALRSLLWSDVRWARFDEDGFGAVVVRAELDKSGVGYAVPLSATCHDVLARRSGAKPDHEYVLTGAAGRPILSVSHTAQAIRAACKRAGCPDPDSPNHHMRRSFGRWAVLGHLTGRPIPIYVVSKWLGHASVAMTEHYLALDTENSTKWMTAADPGPDAEHGGDDQPTARRD